MRTKGHHVLLSIDNFSGHYIDYELTNVAIDFFKPNLTSFIQPLDAGIIRCFKAHYCKHFCQYAIDLNEAGMHDIYMLSLKEGIELAKEAWKDITAKTIQHCWDYTKVQL